MSLSVCHLLRAHLIEFIATFIQPVIVPCIHRNRLSPSLTVCASRFHRHTIFKSTCIAPSAWTSTSWNRYYSIIPYTTLTRQTSTPAGTENPLTVGMTFVLDLETQTNLNRAVALTWMKVATTIPLRSKHRKYYRPRRKGSGLFRKGMKMENRFGRSVDRGRGKTAGSMV